MKNVVFHTNNKSIIVFFLLLNTKKQIFIQTAAASDFHSKDSPKPAKRVAKRSLLVFFKDIFNVVEQYIYSYSFT